ncbi:hypothetical protein B0H11DRAFT_1921478 [Mycena galericulata]|nr:hypothetical protein B0H11DRAFT_1921478 [Mycena galericulata]
MNTSGLLRVQPILAQARKSGVVYGTRATLLASNSHLPKFLPSSQSPSPLARPAARLCDDSATSIFAHQRTTASQPRRLTSVNHLAESSTRRFGGSVSLESLEVNFPVPVLDALQASVTFHWSFESAKVLRLVSIAATAHRVHSSLESLASVLVQSFVYLSFK